MKKISVIISLILTLSCGSEDLKSVYDSRGFDRQVIEKLPIYDSLANVLLENLPTILQQSKAEAFYKYAPTEDGNELEKELPNAAVKIREYFSQLGEDFIYGFEVFKDTTIKIIIRDSLVKSHHVNIMERLSFYPSGTNMKKREFPIKDTILNKHWQYWIWFEEQGLFD